MAELDYAKLYNCTALLLEKDSFVNITSVWELNRSQVLAILNPVFDDSDYTISLARKNSLKDFLADCLYPQLQRPPELHWWQKVVWSSVFAVMLLVATGGNAIVMWIVLGEPKFM